VVRALTQNSADTARPSGDTRLWPRTFPVPFEDVWRAGRELADGGLRGWSVVSADDREGVITAEARTPVFRFTDDVTIRIGLDDEGQTRVDVRSASRVGRMDLGTNARRILRFFRALEQQLARQPPRTPLFGGPERTDESRD
jgi:hypothetical protein